MARLFIEGFEYGDLALWDTVEGAAISTQFGKDGNYCVDCLGYGTGQKYLKKSLTSKSELYVAFRFYPNKETRSFTFYNGTNKLGYINLTALGGHIRAYRGDDTLLATGTAIVAENIWRLIEIFYKPADSGGIFQVKVGGVLDIDYSGDTTPGATTIDAIMIGNDDGNWPPGCFDNIIVDDAAWIGNTKIQGILVSGVGSSTQFVPSAGANYQTVDEIPADEADYNRTTIVGSLDLFAHGSLVDVIESIQSVQVQAKAKLIGTPTPVNLKLAVRSGGVNYASSSKALATTSKTVSNLWEVDPNTGVAWTENGVNAAEIGYQSAS